MCFSAPASFTASTLLTASGIYCTNIAIQKNALQYLPMSVIPLLFGIQQAWEGMVWLSVNSDDTRLVNFYALGFLFFSHFLWPFWMTITVLNLETRKTRRPLLLILAIMGFLYGAFLYFPLLINPSWLSVEAVKGSIQYQINFLITQPWGIWLYVVVCLMALFLSENKSLMRLGWLILVALFLTKFAFSYALISVWCFFAAIISGYLIYSFRFELFPEETEDKVSAI